MHGRWERAATVLVLIAAGVGAVELGLAVLGHGSVAAAIGLAVAGATAGGACLIAWARGPRADPRRLPLLLAGAVVPAFAAFALAPTVDDGAWALALTGAGLSGVVFAVVALYRRRS